MRLYLLLAVTLLSFAPGAVQGADKKKLQIGIKKRVDNCPIKSRKGDVLNMHYTVSTVWERGSELVLCGYQALGVCFELCLVYDPDDGFLWNFIGKAWGWDRIWQQLTQKSTIHFHSGDWTGHQRMGPRPFGVSNPPPPLWCLHTALRASIECAVICISEEFCRSSCFSLECAKERNGSWSFLQSWVSHFLCLFTSVAKGWNISKNLHSMES